MDEMDLIPNEYRANLARRQLLHKFLFACLLVVFCVALGRALLSYLIWRENVQVVQLEQLENASEQNKAKAAAYTLQKQVTEKQLAALNALRGRDRVALFLQAVDLSLGDGVWFDSVHFMRKTGTGTLQDARGGPAAGIIVVPSNAEKAHTLDISQGVDIVGHAANHTVLAEFMRKLGAQPNVVDLQLLNTNLRTYKTMQVVDFSLNLLLDKKPAVSP